ncbi:hypothetical protein D5278_15125 [bacterium 1XD21-13]|nr:hypothetical protein [bacterium 1XD21-13]
MNQKKKKTLLILGIIAGLLFQFIGISLGLGKLRIVSGIFLTLYALLFSLCLNKLSRMSREAEFPEAVRQEEIELHDERNTQIRNRAKARTSDITRWVVIALAWVNFLVRGALWMTLALIGVFVLMYILDFCYMEKYQGEM